MLATDDAFNLAARVGLGVEHVVWLRVSVADDQVYLESRFSTAQLQGRTAAAGPTGVGVTPPVCAAER